MTAAAAPSARCYVCGSAELAADADLRNPTCEADRGARAHLVSMQTAEDGASLAVCECGWQSRAPWARRSDQDAAVRAHWLAQRRGTES